MGLTNQWPLIVVTGSNTGSGESTRKSLPLYPRCNVIVIHQAMGRESIAAKRDAVATTFVADLPATETIRLNDFGRTKASLQSLPERTRMQKTINTLNDNTKIAQKQKSD